MRIMLQIVFVLAVFGWAAAIPTLTSAPQVEAAKGGQAKVIICHQSHDNDNGELMFHTIKVAEPALKGHLKHGDTVGPCPTASPSPSPSPAALAPGYLSDMTERTLAGARN